MALFHLAKPAAIPELQWRYFEPDGASKGEVALLLNYTNSLISVVCTATSESVRIDAYDKNGVIHLRQDYPFGPHRFAQVFAWGDGQDYALQVEALIAL